jgi:hypothetical protein
MPQKSDQTRSLKNNPSEPMPDREATPTNGPSLAPWRLVLHFENSKRAFIDFKTPEPVIVGRADEGEAANIGLDLSPFGGAQKGVSRNHAAFAYDNGMVHIEDLGSTNGTRINGFQLVPNQPYRLRDGDELEFGSARVTVRFFRLPNR